MRIGHLNRIIISTITNLPPTMMVFSVTTTMHHPHRFGRTAATKFIPGPHRLIFRHLHKTRCYATCGDTGGGYLLTETCTAKYLVRIYRVLYNP
jgi:hypothetical protein